MQKEQDKIIKRFDKSQLNAEHNNIDERAMGADMKPSEFVEKTVPDSRDESIDAPTENPRFSESFRFAKVVNKDEKALRKQGRIEK